MGILKTNHVLQRKIELTEFQCWILERKEWDRFSESKDEDDDRDLDMVCIEPNDFYNEIEELLGIEDFDECFVHMKYIDNNSVNLIISVNGVNQRFRIDVA